MKEYTYIRDSSFIPYSNNVLNKNDFIQYYYIKYEIHGLLINKDNKNIYYKGYLNMGEEYGHWIDYEKYLYFL